MTWATVTLIRTSTPRAGCRTGAAHQIARERVGADIAARAKRHAPAEDQVVIIITDAQRSAGLLARKLAGRG